MTDDRLKAMVDEIIGALKQSKIHSAECPMGQAIAMQKRTEMYVRVSDYACECWVEDHS